MSLRAALRRGLDGLHSLRARLILPYTLLTLVTALVGIFVVTRLVASSVRERFINQVLEASRVAADGVVRREQAHLEQLRLMAFTTGVPEAVAAGDGDQLQALLFPLVLNQGVHSLTVVDRDGRELLTLVRDLESGDYAVSQGADLSGVPLVARVLKGEQDTRGDKFAGILQTIYGPYLMTSAPVRDAGGSLVGALLLGTRLDAYLAELKAQALADLIALDAEGRVLATTLPPPEDGLQVLGLTPGQVASLDPGLSRELSFFGRRYQAYYAPLVVRGEPVGVLAVALPSNFVVSSEAVSRDLFSAIFAVATLAIIAIGAWTARSISGPLLRLRDISLAVAAGDLDQRTGIRGKDEVGQLAAVFDLMTFRLRRRTAQAARLYAETVRRNEELAEANLRLQQAQQQLIQSEKLAAVGQLTAGIVHDVKNPLAVISGLAEIVEEDLGPDSPVVEEVRKIRANAQRANRIVSDLLKFARQSSPSLRRQDLCETVATALRLTDYLARKGKVRVVQDLPPGGVMATYDASQIEQVLVNLIQNAIQAMPGGGTLTVAVRQAGDWAEIEVADTGVGIPPEHLNRIFDPFFTTKPEGEGTGLGLSVSYGIVSQHKGRIDVESKVGEGTRFVVRLPRQGGVGEAEAAAVGVSGG